MVTPSKRKSGSPALRLLDPVTDGLSIPKGTRGGPSSVGGWSRLRVASVQHSVVVDPEIGATSLLRKEVIQPHLPVRLPCYDFTPITDPTFDGSLHKGWATGFGCYRLSWCDGRCVQGPGTYSPRRC